LGKLFVSRELVRILQVLNRSQDSTKTAIEFLEQGAAAARFSDLEPADLVLVSTSDGAIAQCTNRLPGSRAIHEGTIVFHCSGLSLAVFFLFSETMVRGLQAFIGRKVLLILLRQSLRFLARTAASKGMMRLCSLSRGYSVAVDLSLKQGNASGLSLERIREILKDSGEKAPPDSKTGGRFRIRMASESLASRGTKLSYRREATAGCGRASLHARIAPQRGGCQSKAAPAATSASNFVAISGGKGAVLRTLRSTKALTHSKVAARVPLVSLTMNMT